MFLRVVRAAGGSGIKHEYVRVVEAYRDKGKTRHRTVLNLGRRDLLAEHLDLNKLMRLLHGETAAAPPGSDVRADDVHALAAWDWGPMLAAGHIWRELGLETTLDRLSGSGRRDNSTLSDRALVLVANRLTSPGSEHGLARWLETDFVCDREGRRWVADWREDAKRRASKTPRVRVEMRQLKGWYRTLDQLQEHKQQIEHALFVTLRDLFSLKVDMVFYDLTSTYFEGAGPPDIGANGHSRDGKPRNPQVLVGLVLVDGWPIAHHVFAGNRRDAATVPEVLSDLERRFGLKRVVFRVFVVRSEEREAFERRHRLKAMERVRAKLEKLTHRVATGRLKVPEKIGAAAARILVRNHGHRYYGWCYKDGAFRFFEHPVHFVREQAYEGKYVIQSEEPYLSAIEAVSLYKDLSEVERAFADLKDVIDMRPVYHRTPERVQAHIFVAALAFLLHRAIEKNLKAAGIDLSATEALTALKSVRVVDIDLGSGHTKRSVTRGTQRAAAVLRALGIADLHPPTPSRPGETLM